MAKKITLKDIAREAGVSVSTVSLVVNGKPGVSEDVQRHVLSIAEKQGYLSRLRASEPRSAVVIISAEPGYTKEEMYLDYVKGMEEESQEAELELLFFPHPWVTYDSSLLSHMLDRHVEGASGIIVLGSIKGCWETIRPMLERYNKPVVALNQIITESNFSFVAVDSVHSMKRLTEHLISLGRRELVFVGWPIDVSYSTGPRLEGFRLALGEAGITWHEGRVVLVGRPLNEDPVERILKAVPSVNGVICVDDALAVAVVTGLKERGFRVPQDVAVGGFDNLPVGRESDPPITTIHFPRVELGRLVIRLLENHLDFPRLGYQWMFVPGELIIRGSSGGGE